MTPRTLKSRKRDIEKSSGYLDISAHRTLAGYLDTIKLSKLQVFLCPSPTLSFILYGCVSVHSSPNGYRVRKRYWPPSPQKFPLPKNDMKCHFESFWGGGNFLGEGCQSKMSRLYVALQWIVNLYSQRNGSNFIVFHWYVIKNAKNCYL